MFGLCQSCVCLVSDQVSAKVSVWYLMVSDQLSVWCLIKCLSGVCSGVCLVSKRCLVCVNLVSVWCHLRVDRGQDQRFLYYVLYVLYILLLYFPNQTHDENINKT